MQCWLSMNRPDDPAPGEDEPVAMTPANNVDATTNAGGSIRNARRHGMLKVAILIAILVALWLAREPLLDLVALLADQQAVAAYIQSWGVWGPLVFILIHLLQIIIAVLPGQFVLIAGGYVFGFTGGLLLNLVTVIAGSQLAFALARVGGRPLVKRLVPAGTLDRWDGIAERHGVVFLISGFLLPVIFPADVMNYVAGLSSMSAGRFFLASFLGRLPSLILMTLIGSHGLELSLEAWIIIALVIIGLFCAGSYALARIRQRG